MREIIMTLIYISLKCIYCEAPDIRIEPNKENLLLAAGDVLKLYCIHVYNGNLDHGATFSKDGAFIPMINDQGFTLQVLEKVPPGSDSTTRTTTLIKEHTKVTDSGIYTCDVHDKSIKISVTVIQVEPVDAVLPPDSTDALELRCNTNGMTIDSNDVRWVWTFNNKTLRNDGKYNIINNGKSGILQIKNPDRTNVGRYLCSLTQKNDVKIEKPRSVFLKASPTINNHTVKPRPTGLDLKCTASGYPIPHIIWTKDGVELNVTENSVVHTEQNVVDSSMVLSDMDDDDEGVYSCIAYNEIEPFNATAQIVIGREERSFLVSDGGPSLKSASIPYMSTVIFVVILSVC